MNRALRLLPLLLAASACTLGKDYQRPPLPSAAAFRGQEATAIPPDAKSLGELSWWETFRDEELQALIRKGLQNNYDLRIAVARVLEARAQLGITRSQQFPEVTASAAAARAGVSRNTNPAVPRTVDRQRSDLVLGADLTFEADLWGKLRRATESARAQLLATQEARWTVVQSLVTGIARGYFELQALDHSLEIARRTVAGREASLRLIQYRKEGGVASAIDLRQAESLLASARTKVPVLERQIEQAENRVALLLGEAPGPIPRRAWQGEAVLVPSIPAGLPAELIERRPDIRAAEHSLVAANANVGVARALFFPQIALTASGGFESAELGRLFDGPSGWFALAANLAAPVFNAGRLSANLEAAEARKEQAILGYQLTVQSAFREVADALVGYRKSRESRFQQAELVVALSAYAEMSQVRYRGGVTSYLEVLDAERQLFDAELALADAQSQELAAFVQVYKALGGGWKTEETAGAPPGP